jgi:hypothetical protein
LSAFFCFVFEQAHTISIQQCGAIRIALIMSVFATNLRPVRLAYQPPASSTFLSEQTSHEQSASSTLLSEQTSTSHQPPANRTG